MNTRLFLILFGAMCLGTAWLVNRIIEAAQNRQVSDPSFAQEEEIGEEDGWPAPSMLEAEDDKFSLACVGVEPYASMYGMSQEDPDFQP